MKYFVESEEISKVRWKMALYAFPPEGARTASWIIFKLYMACMQVASLSQFVSFEIRTLSVADVELVGTGEKTQSKAYIDA